MTYISSKKFNDLLKKVNRLVKVIFEKKVLIEETDRYFGTIKLESFYKTFGMVGILFLGFVYIFSGELQYFIQKCLIIFCSYVPFLCLINFFWLN